MYHVADTARVESLIHKHLGNCEWAKALVIPCKLATCRDDTHIEWFGAAKRGGPLPFHRVRMVMLFCIMRCKAVRDD